MKRKSNPVHYTPTEAEIQHAAYLLWVEAGQPEGCNQEHWFAARELLLHRHSRDPKTRRQELELAEAAAS